MKIGKKRFENNIFLAPMAGVTDSAFRLICREMGAGLVYSEMISAKGIYYNNENTGKMLQIDNRERPCAVQLFGSDPAIMAEMAKKITSGEDCPFDLIDINMGCPAPKIVKNGEGSALMNNPVLVGKIVKQVSGAVDIPVTVKIRKGFNDSSVNAVEIAKISEDNGASTVTVHGRTREQQYSGVADWEIIKKVKDALTIPVIGNGDITTPEKAEQMLSQTECDAIMIGRAACGDPWIFRRTAYYIKTGELLPYPTNAEKIVTALRHAEMTINEKGEFTGVLEMRKHLCWYLKGISGAAEARVRINAAASLDEIKNILYSLL